MVTISWSGLTTASLCGCLNPNPGGECDLQASPSPPSVAALLRKWSGRRVMDHSWLAWSMTKTQSASWSSWSANPTQGVRMAVGKRRFRMSGASDSFWRLLTSATRMLRTVPLSSTRQRNARGELLCLR